MKKIYPGTIAKSAVINALTSEVNKDSDLAFYRNCSTNSRTGSKTKLMGLATRIMLVAGFFLSSYFTQAQNKVTGITVSPAQTGSLVYGASSSVTYDITLASDGAATDGSSTLSLNWTTPAGVTFTPTTATVTANTTSTDVTLTVSSDGTTPAGNYSFTVTSTDSYGSITSGPASSFIVDAAPLTITANDQNKTYGATLALGTSAFTPAGLQNGETIGSVTLTSAGAVNTANAGTYPITASSATGGTFTASNYTITYADGTLTVGTAPLTITANDQNKTYGATLALGTSAFTPAGLQNGETIGSVTLTSAGAVNTANVGTYPITASAATGGTFTASNYTITYADGTLTVGAAPLTITANDQNKTYGATLALGTSAFTPTGLQNGETIGSVTLTSAGAVNTANVGTYPITASSATGGTFTASNYTITYGDGTLTVGTAPLIVTANDQNKIYGATLALGTSAFTPAGLQNGETIGSVTLTSAGAVNTANAGTYPITASSATGGTFTASNYTITYADGTLTVGTAPLTVTANDQNKTYGATLALGTSTFTPTGLQNGETIGSVTLTSAGAVNTANAGTYPITASAATGGTFTASNYTITYADGTLTVGAALLTIAANDQNKTYGATLALGTSAFTPTGLQNGETIGSVTLTSAGAVNTANVGTYPITASAATGGTFTASNYTITYADGTLTVGAALLTIAANDQNKIYGATLALGTSAFTPTGLQNGETIGSVTLTSAGAVNTASVGTYPITASSATGGTFTASNYTITYADGTLTVGAATLTITANNGTKAYGTVLTTGAGSTLFTSTGLQNGETIGSITIASTGAPATATVAGSPYPIVPSAATGGTFNAANYNIVYTNGTLAITQPTLTITANNGTKAYGTVFTTGAGSTLFTSTGLQNGETIGSITIASTGAPATATVAGSPYPIVPSAATGGTFNAANYNIVYTNGTLTITQPTLTITANNGTKAYGTVFTTGAGSTLFTSTGLQNGETIGSITIASTGAPATATVAGSPYPIVPGAATGGTFNAANYNIVYTNGTLTITQPTLTITANNGTKAYGTVFTTGAGSTLFTSTGLQNGETIGSITIASTGAPATATVAGSPYPIVPSAATGGTFNAANYNIVYTNGTLTVTKPTLTITANNGTKAYGTVFTTGAGSTLFTSTGLQNGETIGSITISSTGAPAIATVAGSPYPIVPGAATGGTFNAANYNIVYTNGTLTITQPTLTITANNGTKAYGTVFTTGAGSTLFTSTGLQNGETIGSITIASTGAPAIATVAGSPYPIVPGTATGGTFNAANYNIVYTNGTLTVTPATPSIVVASSLNPSCFGSSVTFTATITSSPNVTGSVQFFDGATSLGTVAVTANVATLTTSSLTAASHSITAKYLGDANFAVVTSAVLTQIVNAPPTTTGVTICQGGSGSLTSSAGCAASTPGTAGPNLAGAGASGGGAGASWVNPGRVTANDGSSATVTPGTGTTSSEALNATNFNFNIIPANATINGIQVSIGRFRNGGTSGNIQDYSITLLGGSGASNDYANLGVSWPAAEAAANYGAANDTWGLTWTPAQINANSFGVALRVINTNNRVANVDYISVTISYSIPGTLNWYTVSSGGSAIGNGSPFNPVGVAGSGLPNTNTPGTYAFYAECTAAAPGCRTATNFVINAQPTAFTVGGTGTYCSTSGGDVTLSGSASGVNYQLFRGATGLSTLAGTGAALDFGFQTTAGTYTVVATNATTTCTATMTGSAVITITPQPNTTFTYSTYTYCATGNSVTPTLAGSPTTGTFSSLPAGVSFVSTATGQINLGASTPGTYSIVYTVPASGGCAVYTFTQPTSVVINAQPTLFTVNGTGTYCSTSGGDVTLSGSATGVNYKLFRGATGLGTIAGTGAALDFGFQTTAGTYTVVATNATTGCSTTMTGSAVITITPQPNTTFSYSTYTYCATGNSVTPTLAGSPTTGTFSASPAGVNFVSTSTGQINLGTSTPGTYSITYTVPASGGCAVYTYTQPTNIVINAQPALFTVGGTGTYCSTTGGDVTLSGSSSGVNYKLFRGATGLGTIAGTGAALDFGFQTTAGTYTVVATNATTGCTTTMTGSAVITITPQPTTTFTYSTYTYCATGNSATPTLGGSPTTGTFSALPGGLNFVSTSTGQVNLGTSAPGTYSITYTVPASGGCAVYTYTQPTNIVINALPTIFSVTGGGSYCSGGTGVAIGLSGSQSGVNYQLKSGAANVGGPVAGTGVAISFGNQTTATTYTVIATNATTGCQNTMNGNATVTINALPAAPTITPPSATVCQGTIQSLFSGTTTASSVTFNSSGSPAIPNNSAAGVANTIAASGIPAGSTINSISVNFNITEPYDRDLVINLKAPTTNNILNLVNNEGPGGFFNTSNFTNTIVSSIGATTFASSNPTYTGTFAPDAVIGAVASTGNTANVGSFNNLYNTSSDLNGNWQLSLRDGNSEGGNGTLNNWSITINYTAPATPQAVTWSPITDLYTDAAATTAYTAGTSIATVYVKPSASGTKTYAATATNAQGCTNSTNVVLTVNPQPTGIITVTENSGTTPNDNIICAGDPVTFTATSGYGSYIFKINGTIVQAGSANIYSSSTLNNGDVMTVDVADSSNCGATFGPVTITVNPLPTPTLSANTLTICAGDNVTFTAGGGTSYNFKVNGSSLQSGASNTYSTIGLTNGASVTVDVTNANGCLATSSPVIITVNNLPAGSLSAAENSGTANDNKICAGSNVTFTATGGYSNYNFKINGISAQNSASNTFSTTTLTNGQVVTVDVISANGCNASFGPPQVITVFTAPAGSLNVTENSGTANDNIICIGANVKFTATSGYTTYAFYLNGTGSALQSGASNIYNTTSLSNGDYITVIVTNSNGCASTFTSAAITVVSLPSGTLSASVTTICAGDNIDFTATAGFANYNFKVNGLSFQNGATNTASYSAFGNGDVVTVDVSNAQTCLATFNSLTINVNALPAGTLSVTENSGNNPNDGIICTGANVTFTATPGFANYNFKLNGTTVQYSTSNTYTTNTLANGDVVSVEVTNASNCVATFNTITITVNSYPVVQSIAGATTVCVNNTVTLSDGTSGGSWSGSDATIATINNAGVLTGIAPGIVTISYSLTNANGCSTTVTQQDTVYALPVVAAITGNVNICTNDNSQLNDVTPGGAWSSDNTSVATVDATGLVTGVSQGTAIISYIVTNANGCSAKDTAKVTISLAPTVAPITTTAPSFDVCVGSNITLKDATSGGVWRSGDNSIATINSGGIVTGVSAGNDSIFYTITTTCLQVVADTVIITVHALPNNYSLTGGGAYCSGGTGVVIGLSGSESGVNYQLFKGAGAIGSPVSGTGSAISFGNQTAAGTYTVVATNSTSSCTSNISGSVTVTVNPLPNIFNITGGGAFCSGGTGVAIGLSGSQSGINYQLYNGAGTAGAPVAGTGSAISFGNQTAAGTYTVVATNATTSCASNMSGSVTITANPLPTVFNITGGGTYCSGGAGVAIGLSGSESGVKYQLYNGASTVGSPVNGTGSSISFGNQTASGTYTVIAANATTSCTSNMNGSATINVNPLPTVFNITGGGAYCNGSAGVVVGLSGSQSGVNYQLYNGASTVGGPVSGTGAALNFGNQTAAGTYTVIATNATTSCASNMSGSATVTVNARPTGVISGTQPICSGNNATLTLTVTGSGTISGTLSDGTAFSGTAPAINVNVTPASLTTYTIATLSDANCTAIATDKTGSATVTVNSPTAISTVTATPSAICLGDNTNLVASGPTPPGTVFSNNFNTAGNIAPFTVVNGSPFNNPSSTPIPRQWTNEPNNYNYTDAPSGINVTFRPGSRFMVAIADTISGTYFVNTTLQSSSQNTAGYSSLTLQYTTYYRSWNGDIADVEVSTNNGTTWTVADDLYAAAVANGGAIGATNAFSTRSVNLNAYINQASLLIRFRYVSNDGYYFALDNVSLTGTLSLYNFSWTVSPAANAGLPAGSGTPSAANASIVATPTAAGTYIYTATLTNSSGCTSAKNVTVTVNPVPTVTISANYCAVPGKVQLTATSAGATSYLWSTGETTQVINVDVAGTYLVTVTGANGCGGNASIQVAQELVTNGDFETGGLRPTSVTGFTSDYVFKPDTYLTFPGLNPAGQGILYDDSGNNAFSITPSGQDTHINFWGHDHTSGNGNFMAVNGHGNTLVVWKETVPVQPNTTYYFSAWAMSLNSGGNYAQLQFSVNGTLVGTTAALGAHGESNSSPDTWVRFYGNWTSGPTTTSAAIYINDLQAALGGNDFGLDDVSFATLSTFIDLTSGPGTDAQTVCVNNPITNITYDIGNGNAGGPAVTGLPTGVTSVFAANTLTISGTPTVAGVYTYKITTTGCAPFTVTGTIKAAAQKLTLKSGNASPTICINSTITPIVYQVSGSGGSNATVKGLPSGLTGNYNSTDSTFTISGSPTIAGIFKDTVITTGTCNSDTAYGTITVQNQTIALTSGPASQSVCLNDAITSLIYTIGGTGTGASITAGSLPNGVAGFYSGGSFIISGTPLAPASGTYNFTITTSGTCSPGASVSGTIIINPDATITLSSAAGTNAQTVCLGSPITNVTYNIGGGGTGASVTGLPAGLSGGFSAGVFTISGTPTVTGIFSYTVTTSGTCAQNTATGTITVQNQTITLTSGSASPTLCMGSTLTNIVFTIGGSATGATLTGSLPTGVTGVLSGNTFTISGSPSQLGTFNYTVTTTGSCTPAAFVSGTITVNNGSVGGSLPALVSTCSGVGGTLNLTGNTGNVVRWESSVDGGTTWINIANTTTTLPYNVTVPTQYRALVKSGSCTGVYSSVALVGVHNYWTGAISTDWNTAGNWSDNQVPSLSCPNVYIPNTPNKPVLSGAPVATIGSLNIFAGAVLTINGTGLLQVAGTIANAGTFDVTGGALEYNGASAQTITANLFATNKIKDLVISNNVLLSGVDSLTGTLSFGSSNKTFTTNGNLTIKSTILATGSVGQVTNGNHITGDVVVERYIATGTAGAPNHGKSWQLLAIPTFGSQTIKAAWQEGATATNISTLGAAGPGNPVPGYGTMITSAVANAATQPAPGFDAFTSPGPSMKIYDSLSTNYYGTATTQVPIFNQRGYFVFVRGDRSVYTSTGNANPTVLRTKGTLFTPDNAPLISHVATGLFESVGNPYASAIDMRNITLTGGTQQFFTVWDPRLGGAYNYGAFQTFSFDGTNYTVTPGGGSYGPAGAVNNYIQSGQAFLVQAFGSAGTVSFTESCKAGGSSLFTTPDPVNQVVHTLRTSLNTVNPDGSAGSVLDGVLSQFDDTYSNAVDGMDARKMTNTGENLGIKTAGKLLSIERRHTVTQQDTIFLNITSERNQPYRFHFDAENLDPSVQGYLVDNYLGTRTPLNMAGATDVNFTVAAVTGSNAANRFMIVFEPLKALPVTFTSVKAWIQDKNIDVQWRVDNEVNMKQYEVEKSTDGSRFATIAQQQPTANNGGSAVYVSADANPATGFNYYRVKSVDINGKTSYTNVVKVFMGSIKEDITIYPNPITDGMIHLQFLNEPAGKYNIRLLNKLGHVILQREVTRADGNGTEFIKWDYNLAHGMYQLEVTRPDGSVKDINVMY